MGDGRQPEGVREKMGVQRADARADGTSRAGGIEPAQRPCDVGDGCRHRRPSNPPDDLGPDARRVTDGGCCGAAFFGRYLADHIPRAQYFEQPGEHLSGSGDVDLLADRIEAFLTGRRAEVVVDRVLATVLFSDIVASTEKASALGDRRWRSLLDDHDTLVRDCAGSHRGRLIRMMGDGALATFDGPGRAILCAREIRDGVRGLGMDVRVGLHTGEIELRGDEVGGIAVHIGARVAALAGPSEVLVSRTVKDLVAGSGLAFVDRGMHPLKGVAEEWQLYAVAK
jgi:class 3 adenylate cyclase